MIVAFQIDAAGFALDLRVRTDHSLRECIVQNDSYRTAHSHFAA